MANKICYSISHELICLNNVEMYQFAVVNKFNEEGKRNIMQKDATAQKCVLSFIHKTFTF